MFYHTYSKYPVYIGALIALLFIAACNLQPFSSVRIEAKPTLYVPLGSKSITEDEVFKKLETILQEKDKNIRLYRYPPTGTAPNALHYLIHYPIKSLDFDIGSYFGGDASIHNTALSQKFEKNISIPQLSKDWNRFLEYYPVVPELRLDLPQGSYSLKHDFVLGVAFSVIAKTDIDYKL